jgi:hemerythrin
MSFVDWSGSLSVGIEEIDNQHKKLIAIANRLHTAMIQGKGRNIVGEIISELVDYASVHFETEEKYMREFGFDGLDEHSVEHDDFTRKVLDFRSEFNKQNLLLSADVMNFLSNWLITHMLETDRKYMECFYKNGLK